MLREHAKELLPIIAAFADGKWVQFLNGKGLWEVAVNPSFNLDPTRYRIKPIEMYANEYAHGYGRLYADSKQAERQADAGGGSLVRTAVKFVEAS